MQKGMLSGLVIRLRTILPFVICCDVVALFVIIVCSIAKVREEPWLYFVLIGCFMLTLFAPLLDYFWGGVLGWYDKHFIVDENGVTYYTRKDRFNLKWEEVRHIVLYPDRLGRFKEHCFVCFIATDDIPGNLSQWRNFDKAAFGIQYRPALVAAIERFGGRSVELLEHMK